MKSVFVIGDTISLDYHKFMKDMLYERADYSSDIFSANGVDSIQVLEYLNEIDKEGKKYDILLINCGLNDIKRNHHNMKKQIDKEDYEKNLKRILEIGQDISNKVYWINSTPVDNDLHNQSTLRSYRYDWDVVEYNKIADKVMNENNVDVIDLYDYTKSFETKDMYRDYIHFNDDISAKQAEFIYKKQYKYEK